VHLLIGVLVQHFAVKGQLVFGFDGHSLAKGEGVEIALRVVEGDVEIVEMLEGSVEDLAICQGDGYLYGGRAPGIEKCLLEVGGFSLCSDVGKISACRVAGAAFAFAVEEGFPPVGVAGNHIQHLVSAAVSGQLDLEMKILGDLPELLSGQGGESRHSFAGASFVHDRPDHLALVIVEYDGGAKQIGPTAAAGIGAMAEPAGRLEGLLALGCHFGVGHAAKAKEFAGADAASVLLLVAVGSAIVLCRSGSRRLRLGLGLIRWLILRIERDRDEQPHEEDPDSPASPQSSSRVLPRYTPVFPASTACLTLI
jgi:hypothetical protein